MVNKYNAKKTVVDGITFASKAEAKRYGELKQLEDQGEIGFLELQPKFECIINGKRICNYFADFRYADPRRIETHTTVTVIEDVKGVKTPVYRLKKKLVEALHNIEITEITK
ncbi:DUF1064 domain-containing protein [Candidatus Pacearchaeota archaeon]|nr:DUF1064 domain-containing protein [Candidatus Pacearchaeota archaeon]